MTEQINDVRRPARDELRRRLREMGALTDDWVPAFEAVDRAGFLPDVIWAHDMATRQNTPIDRDTDPDGWWGAADSNLPLVTQWDDGEHEGLEPGDLSTSSASMPSVVFRMLRDLEVADGMRVLEIGTGTGYNAALLAHRLGDGNVTSIEVDEAVTAQACGALEAAGLRPHVVCGDGFKGWPDSAPYDRVIATVGVRAVPQPWVEQTRPGGMILVPWGTNFTTRDALVRLTVAEDGTASGPFLSWVEFMKLRSQRLVWPRFEDYLPDGWPGDSVESSSDLTADAVVPADPFGTTAFILGLAVGGCVQSVQRSDSGVSAWFVSLVDKSWAMARWTGDGPAAVFQSGHRRLWDSVEQAWHWWDDRGRPDVDQFGLTVDADGANRVWFEEPDRSLPPTVTA